MPERLGVVVVKHFEFTFALSIVYMTVIFCCYSSFIYQALLLKVSIKWAVVLILQLHFGGYFFLSLCSILELCVLMLFYHIGGAAVAYFYSPPKATNTPTIKVSYSCTTNMINNIKKHNSKITAKRQKERSSKVQLQE